MGNTKLYFKGLHIKLKNSLFCGFKGWLIFNLANLTLLELSLYNVFHKKHMSDYQRVISQSLKEKAHYQRKQNIIPFFEVMLVMPVVFFSIHYLWQHIGIQCTPLEIHLICLAACMGIMIMICLTLRILGIRKDCCGTIEHPIYRNTAAHNNSYVNFKGPKSIEGTAIEKGTYITIYNDTTTFLTTKNLLFSILTSPLTAIKAAIELILATIEILELPFSLLLDICTLLHNKITHSKSNTPNFKHAKANINNMSSFLYAGARDLIVAASLGLLNAEIIKQNDKTARRSPISYLDQALTSNVVPTERTKPGAYSSLAPYNPSKQQAYQL